MTPFALVLIPPFLLKLLIFGALAMSGLGALILLILLWRDWRNHQLW